MTTYWLKGPGLYHPGSQGVCNKPAVDSPSGCIVNGQYWMPQQTALCAGRKVWCTTPENVRGIGGHRSRCHAGYPEQCPTSSVQPALSKLCCVETCGGCSQPRGKAPLQNWGLGVRNFHFNGAGLAALMAMDAGTKAAISSRTAAW